MSAIPWLGWTLAAVSVLIGSGLLLADRLTPAATGAPSTMLPLHAEQTRIDRELTPYLAQHSGLTAVVMLANGLDAFAARSTMTRAAGRSLDLQYYVWRDDLVGRLLAREVHAAAERGVRVRLLLDDINAEGLDPALMLLDAHPSIEIRLYNPFRNRAGLKRLIEMVQRVFSINHRMHNKAWIADGRIAIVGGRNIGNEYFNAHESVNFRDLDLMIAGPAAEEAGTIFDAFWNGRSAVPIAVLHEKSPAALREFVESLDEEAERAAAQPYLDRVWSSLRQSLEAGPGLHWSGGLTVVSDPPNKSTDEDRSGWLVERIVKQLNATRSEALLISPYFVPGEAATRELGALAQSGARVGVITNSLAANDVPVVHSGYSRYRERLLAGGVEIHEIRRSGPPANAGLFGSSGASLHTKAYIVDGNHGFVGSFNLDPRSANLNTEMGVMFDDATLAARVRDEYHRLAAPESSYAVVRDGAGRIRWLDGSVQPPRELDREPDAGPLLRALARVLSWLPLDSQL